VRLSPAEVARDNWCCFGKENPKSEREYSLVWCGLWRGARRSQVAAAPFCFELLTRQLSSFDRLQKVFSVCEFFSFSPNLPAAHFRHTVAGPTATMVLMRRAARNILAAAALLLCAHAAQAAVLGIDYGSEYVKVSIVAPGRTPISIVINEISKRKSTAAVSFTGGDRWLMEEAMNYNARFPERVFTRMRDLLGKQTAVPAFQEYLVQDGNLAPRHKKTKKTQVD